MLIRYVGAPLLMILTLAVGYAPTPYLSQLGAWIVCAVIAILWQMTARDYDAAHDHQRRHVIDRGLAVLQQSDRRQRPRGLSNDERRRG